MPVHMVPCLHCGEDVEVWLTEDGDPTDIREGCECVYSADDLRAMVEEACRVQGMSLEGQDD
jgi:hypothetical protein